MIAKRNAARKGKLENSELPKYMASLIEFNTSELGFKKKSIWHEPEVFI